MKKKALLALIGLATAVGCGGDSGAGGTAGSSAAPVAGGMAVGMAGNTAAAGSSGSATAGSSAGRGAAGSTAGTGAAGRPAAGSGAAGMSAAGSAAGMGAAAGSGGMNGMMTAGSSAAGQSGAAGAGMPSGMGMLGGPLMYTGPFTMGMTIPEKHKCPSMGDNKSPPLAWKGGPADTKSFAVVLFDTTYMMLHWVIWDIPPTVSELPEGLAEGYELTTPMGAHQVAQMCMGAHSYCGPCSGGGGLPAGTYEYRLYALNTEKLSLTESSTGAQAQMAVEAAMLEMTKWAGMPPN